MTRYEILKQLKDIDNFTLNVIKYMLDYIECGDFKQTIQEALEIIKKNLDKIEDLDEFTTENEVCELVEELMGV